MHWLAEGLASLLDKLAKAEGSNSPKGSGREGPTVGFELRGADGSSASEWAELAEKLRQSEEQPGRVRQLLELELHDTAEFVEIIIIESRLDPGLTKVKVDADMLVVESIQQREHFYGEALLPQAMAGRSCVRVYQNGVLSLRWSKKSRAGRRSSGAAKND